MPIFGEDPKDQTIQILQDQVKHLQALLEERDKTILALTDASAYRAVHPTEEPPPIGKPEPSFDQVRGTDYRPEFTMGDIRAKFGDEH